MKAYYYTYTRQGKKIHMMEIVLLNSSRTQYYFNSAKEAKAFAKAQGAQAWNY
jgi:hypothetical protein